MLQSPQMAAESSVSTLQTCLARGSRRKRRPKLSPNTGRSSRYCFRSAKIPSSKNPNPRENLNNQVSKSQLCLFILKPLGFEDSLGFDAWDLVISPGLSARSLLAKAYAPLGLLGLFALCVCSASRPITADRE